MHFPFKNHSLKRHLFLGNGSHGLVAVSFSPSVLRQVRGLLILFPCKTQMEKIINSSFPAAFCRRVVLQLTLKPHRWTCCKLSLIVLCAILNQLQKIYPIFIIINFLFLKQHIPARLRENVNWICLY